ncbi:acyl carrier protein [Ruminococcus sp. YE71]|uniref:acyl carrier protein n=1 Tax=unclassified Ruminococcus TaxID=2608920 RepID=UPI000888F22A|nr:MULTISPECIES: acyl carrier protein [unclassified Ruminococcus]SDA29822.1 acyl carrier protein [Ruminococcus sp. YE78]SFW48913.1 acyl carrier protein [Ruminococcus sp. YE71]
MEAQFKEILSNYCSVEAGDITDEMNLRSDIGLSSLDLMTFLGDLEDEFDIEFDFGDNGQKLTGINTVGDAIALLREYIG